MAKPKTSKRYTREFRQELIALHRGPKHPGAVTRVWSHPLDDLVVGEAGRS